MASWLNRIQEQTPGFERDVVERYTARLLGLARQKLPSPLRRRVDPEDVVQSVYRSFFQRLQDGRFRFDDSQDLWRLLATMTFRKACNARDHHLRERRDARRDSPLPPGDHSQAQAAVDLLATPDDGDIDVLWNCLERLLDGLPEMCRTIVVARLQGLSIEQIAKQVNRSRRTVLRVLAGVTAAATQDEDAAP